MTIVFVLLAFAGMLWLDFPGLLKRKNKKNIFFYLLLVALSLTFVLLHVAGVKLQSPILMLDDFLEKVLHVGYPPQ